MFNEEIYSKAYVEVETVLFVLNDSLSEKIPEEVMTALAKNKNKEYIFNYDFNKPIHEQDISIEAKIILSKIYKDYLCSEEEKEKWKEYDMFCLSKKEEMKKKKFKDKYLKFGKK